MADISEITFKITSPECGVIKKQIKELKEFLMAKFDEVISRIDTATNEIASDIQKLREQVTTGMTAEEVADVQSKLDAHASRLEQMGADPENPVPEPEPEEPAPVERKKR